MNLSLDFDDTYTRDPKMWQSVIKTMQESGHKVYLVTWRTPEECKELPEELTNIVDGVYPTSRKAKESYMLSQGINIHVWLDDNAWAVTHTMEGWE